MSTFRGRLKFIRHNPELYLMIVPGIVLLILFKYIPMYGVVMAFMDYNPMKGIMGSEWVGMEHFVRFIQFEKFQAAALEYSAAQFI